MMITPKCNRPPICVILLIFFNHELFVIIKMMITSRCNPHSQKKRLMHKNMFITNLIDLMCLIICKLAVTVSQMRPYYH